MGAPSAGRNWFSVRCLFRTPDTDPDTDLSLYEERVTLWQAGSPEESIALAEAEAHAYTAGGSAEYVGLAQSFSLFDSPASGGEVFSLIRDSELAPDDYIDRFFDTGRERQKDYRAQD